MIPRIPHPMTPNHLAILKEHFPSQLAIRPAREDLETTSQTLYNTIEHQIQMTSCLVIWFPIAHRQGLTHHECVVQLFGGVRV